MKVGDELELVCSNIGKDGDGICKTPEGLVVIVPSAQPNRQYNVKIAKIVCNEQRRPKYAFGEIV